MSLAKELARGKFLSLVVKDGYEMVERVNSTGVVVILAVTDDDRLVLVEQFRAPLARNAVELPAGLVSDVETARGESMEDAARRELEEETGYRAERFEELGVWPTSSGMTSETVTVFRAYGLKQVGAGGGDESERIAVHVIPRSDLEAFFAKKKTEGALIDPKIYASLYLLSRRP